MNSDDLLFFLLVAEAGSISGAAIRSGCDASTLSRRIAQLEKTAGARLFHRSGRGVSLTAQGEVLRGHAEQVRRALAAATEALQHSAGQGPAQLRIAAQPTIAKTLFGELFHRLRGRWPDTRISFIEGLAGKLLGDLHAGDVDVAVLYRPEQPGPLVYEPLLNERLYLLAPADDPLTQAHVDRHGFADLPLILPSTHHGLRRFVESIAAREGFTPRIALECNSSIAITTQLVFKRCGYTVLPLAAAQEDIAAGRLRSYELRGEQTHRCIALVAGKTAMAGSDLWEVNGLIARTAEQLVATGQWPGAELVTPASDAPPA